MLKQIFLALILVLPAIGHCTEAAQNLQRGSQATGTVDELNPTRRRVGIDDRTFYYTANTSVTKLGGGPGSYTDLSKGQSIQYYYTLDDAKRLVITHIQILSEGAGASR